MADDTLTQESPPLGALLAAGWRPEELEWERLQEQALEHAAAGAPEQAAPLWAAALQLGRELFEADDPRLATSLANHAGGLRRGGDDALADELLDEAILTWGRSGPWIGRMATEQRARSSTFHLRLARKNPGGFESLQKNRHAVLAMVGQQALAARKAGEPADPAGQQESWEKQKPRNFTDGRKLIAAVLLLAG